jgi:hypothetical protein
MDSKKTFPKNKYLNKNLEIVKICKFISRKLFLNCLKLIKIM